MTYLIGYMLGFYLLYILVALCFKHRISLIACTILGFVIGVINIVIKQSFYELLGIIIASILIFLIPHIQIKSDNKKNTKYTNDNSKKMDNEDENELSLINEKKNVETTIDDLFKQLKSSIDIKEEKNIFNKILDLVREDNGLISLSIAEIYKYSDIVDLQKAKEVLSANIYEKVLLLHKQFLNDKMLSKNYYTSEYYFNYEGYLVKCRDIALAFTMLSSSSAFINNIYLTNLHKCSTDLEVGYMQGAANLVVDNMVHSIEWGMLLRRYKRYVYEIIDDGEEDIHNIENYEYDEIIEDIVKNFIDDKDVMDMESINSIIKSHFNRYYLSTDDNFFFKK